MALITRPRTLNPNKLGPLQDWLAGQLGAEAVTVDRIDLLPGGAVGENWRLDVSVFGSIHAGPHAWVLKTDATSNMAMSHDRADEFACLKKAHEAGVRVPEPVAAYPGRDLLGAPFMIAGHASGYAQGFKMARDPVVEKKATELATSLGRELAKIHAIRPPSHDLDFLEVPDISPALIQLQKMRANLDLISEPHPALEYCLCWLERNAPPKGEIVLCHGDFRTGNFMADDGKLTGILDWEFCHWGDPHIDIGWFCAPCWRFGADAREAGGIGPREAFYKGYNAEARTPLDPDIVPYWEALAAARWAVVALLQGERHVSGGEASVELMLTGLMAPEMEYDALQGILALEGRSR